MKTKKFNIEGMHCVSCEILLEKELKKNSQLKKCHISHKHGTAEIKCDSDDFPYDEVEQAIKNCGYKIVQENAHKKTKSVKKSFSINDLTQLVLIIISVAFGAYLLNKLEISRFFPDVNQNVGVLVALLLGVIASLSTCLALTGGIVMSFGGIYKTENGSLLNRVAPHLYFHIGRIVGFALLGGILGLVGSKINYSLSFTGYLTILVGIVMFYIGLQIIELVPNITKLGFHLPKSLSNKIHSLQENDHHFTPIIIGVLTFFLPCGFTQSMQLAAVASGSFWTGALIMGAFALGTLPVLLSVGVGSSFAKKANFAFFKKLIGVIIVFFAFYSFNAGLVLAGLTSPFSYLKSDKNIETAQVKNSVQVVKMDVDYTFNPTEFKIKKGVPVRWEINGINITGCSNKVTIPKLNVTSEELKPGLNIVEFTPTEEGILPFSCWMGMLNGRFIVTD